MAKKPDQETIDAIRADAAAGLNTNQIAEKNGVSWETARKYVGGHAAPKNGKRRAGGGQKRRGQKRQRAFSRGADQRRPGRSVELAHA
jgi:transposase